MYQQKGNDGSKQRVVKEQQRCDRATLWRRDFEKFSKLREVLGEVYWQSKFWKSAALCLQISGDHAKRAMFGIAFNLAF